MIGINSLVLEERFGKTDVAGVIQNGRSGFWSLGSAYEEFYRHRKYEFW